MQCWMSEGKRLQVELAHHQVGWKALPIDAVHRIPSQILVVRDFAIIRIEVDARNTSQPRLLFDRSDQRATYAKPAKL